ncbi:MAG: hypothetical protein ACK50O_00230, partial [Pirellulaceae bacterium]
IAWPGRPCHARGQATRLRVANAARRWSAAKDGWYQTVHHLAMVATKRGGYEEDGEEEARLRVLRGIAWPGRPCHARDQATRLRVANAARRWSAAKDGRYQAVHHLAMVATKRLATKRLATKRLATKRLAMMRVAMMRVAMMRVATKRVAMK